MEFARNYLTITAPIILVIWGISRLFRKLTGIYIPLYFYVIIGGITGALVELITVN